MTEDYIENNRNYACSCSLSTIYQFYWTFSHININRIKIKLICTRCKIGQKNLPQSTDIFLKLVLINFKLSDCTYIAYLLEIGWQYKSTNRALLIVFYDEYSWQYHLHINSNSLKRLNRYREGSINKLCSSCQHNTS